MYPGFTLDIQAAIQASLVAWVNALPIGAAILLPRVYMPAQLSFSLQRKNGSN
jgi:hypothetical protein